LLHRRERRRIGEAAVHDHVDAATDGQSHPRRTDGVCCDFEMGRVCLLHRRLERIGRDFDRVRMIETVLRPARYAHLDHVDMVLHVRTDSIAELLAAANPDTAEVARLAGLAKPWPGGDDTRPGPAARCDAVSNRQRCVGERPEVLHGGEPGEERLDAAAIDFSERQVHVCVDEPRQQGHVTQVDDGGRIG
jgi:hypothetical protein